MDDFVYAALSDSASSPEIRVLDLHPAEVNDPIICELRHVKMSSKPHYRALSYCWGKSPPSKIIICNGTRFVVTESLYLALQRLREPPGGDFRHVWADAICINQADKAEKNVQVGLMSQIYIEAEFVDAWLGPAADASDGLISRLEEIGTRAHAAGIMDFAPQWSMMLRSGVWWKNKGEADSSMDPRLVDICDALNKLSDDLADSRAYSGINEFAARGYWSRVWVTQEIVTSKRIQILCGPSSLSFQSFAASVLFEGWHAVRQRDLQRRAAEGPNQVPPEQYDIKNLSSLVGAKRRWLGQLGKPRDTLFELFIRTCLGHTYTCDQRATDMRDLVYGLLPMARDREDLGIEIDYGKSVQEVFTDAARALIYRGYMSILAWNQPPKIVQGLPSWVPDLSTPFSDACGEQRHHKIYQAAGPQSYPLLPTTFPPFLSPSQGLSPLSLTCYPIDTIDIVGKPWQSDNTFNAAATNAYLSEIEAFTMSRPSYPPQVGTVPLLRQTQERWAEAYWRIPTADQVYTGDRTRADQSLYKAYLEVRTLMSCGEPKDEATDQALAYGIRNLSRDAFMYCINLGYQITRKPFISKSGYVGLVPKEAAPGDRLVVVQGASVPYVFRGLADGHGRWELIGEVYIEGLMDGEVLEDGFVSAEILQVY